MRGLGTKVITRRLAVRGRSMVHHSHARNAILRAKVSPSDSGDRAASRNALEAFRSAPRSTPTGCSIAWISSCKKRRPISAITGASPRHHCQRSESRHHAPPTDRQCPCPQSGDSADNADADAGSSVGGRDATRSRRLDGSFRPPRPRKRASHRAGTGAFTRRIVFGTMAGEHTDHVNGNHAATNRITPPLTLRSLAVEE